MRRGARRLLPFLLLAPVPLLACDAGGPAQADVVYSEENRRYRVVVERPGGGAQLRAAVEPRAHFHLSTEFPSKLQLGEARFTRDDASVLSEERVAFEVPLAAAGGGVSTAGALTFGLCEEDTCERVTERFQVQLGTRVLRSVRGMRLIVSSS